MAKPKHEIRNPKQIRRFKCGKSKTGDGKNAPFRFRSLEVVSDFALRDSDFLTVAGARVNVLTTKVDRYRALAQQTAI